MAITTFQIIARSGSSFDVRMTSGGGDSRTVPGFGSKHEADAWIEQTKRMRHNLDPRHVVTPRKAGQR